MKKDGRLKPFEVRVGARTHLRPEVRDFLLAGGCRPRVDSPWARWSKGEAAPAPERQQESRVSADSQGRYDFWIKGGYGRLAGPDEPELSDGEFWDHVAAIVTGMYLGKSYTGPELADLSYQLDEARACVDAGIRWDQARWDRASALALIEEASDCAAARSELGRMLEAGTIPAELLPQVREALAHQQEGQANG